MNAIGTAAMAIGALAFSAILPVAQSFAGQPGQSSYDDAVVVPTGPEVQQRLQQVAEQLRAAQLASVSVTQARDEYLAAQRAYEFGMYDDAMTDSNKAEREIPDNPNWLGQANLAAR
jgi:hypothetical protein